MKLIQLSRLHRNTAKRLYQDQLFPFHLPTERIKGIVHRYRWFIVFYIIMGLVIPAITSGIAASHRASEARRDAVRAVQQQKATKQQLEQKRLENEQLKKDLKDAQTKKAATLAAAVVIPPAPKPVPAITYVAPPPPVIISGCGDNFYANYIYMHESGCNTSSVNSIGCRGIGQACPGSKLPCGADYACQNAFFTAYALSTYGSWANAYNFWLAHRWW